MLRAIIQLGKCYSGVLSDPKQKVFRRMALATEACFKRLSNDRSLKKLLERDIVQTGRVLPATLSVAGFFHHAYIGRKGWRTFGVHYDADRADFRGAEEMLRSMTVGVHRHLLFGIWGIKVPADITNLPPNTYASLLAAVRTTCQDPRLENVSAIRLDHSRHLSLDSGPAGERTLVLSVKQLEQHPFIAHIESLNLKEE